MIYNASKVSYHLTEHNLLNQSFVAGHLRVFSDVSLSKIMLQLISLIISLGQIPTTEIQVCCQEVDPFQPVLPSAFQKVCNNL